MIKYLLFFLLLSPFILPSFLNAQEDELINSELDRTLEEEKKNVAVDSEAKKEQDAEQVSKNIDAALNNYDRIMQNQPKSKANTINSRIQENEKLITERSQKLEAEQDNLRKAKIDLLTRYMNLKKAREEGRIPEKIFKEKEAKILAQYNYNVHALENDIAFYKGDIHESQERLSTLKEEEKMHKMENPEVYKAREPKKNVLDTLLTDIKKHSRFKVKNAFSHVSSQDLHSPGYNSNYRHLTALYNRSIIHHDIDDFARSKAYLYEYLSLAESLSVEIAEDDYFQACYLAYLTRDWGNVKNFSSNLSTTNRNELATVFSDETL